MHAGTAGKTAKILHSGFQTTLVSCSTPKAAAVRVYSIHKLEVPHAVSGAACAYHVELGVGDRPRRRTDPPPAMSQPPGRAYIANAHLAWARGPGEDARAT